ncbi:MAG: S9 family peptidase [Bacteroidaceae bacterium]|nr:S9 family peptidase [Bacteroidaceae bacterium]
MKHLFPTLTFLIITGITLSAEEVQVKKLRITQPYTSERPFMTDTADVNGKAWDLSKNLMDNSVSPLAWKQGTVTEDSVLAAPATDAVRLAGFTVENQNFAKVSVKVSGPKDFQIYINGQQGADQNLVPGRHDVVLKIRQTANEADTLRVSIDCQQHLTLNPTGKAPYTLKTLMYGERMNGVSISADGRFLTLDKSLTHTDANSDRTKYLIDLKTGHRSIISDFRQWTSKGHNYIAAHTLANMTTQYETVDAETSVHTALFNDLSNQSGWFLPGEQQMLVYDQTQGPKEDEEVFQVLTPDDRQPGWRNRSNLKLLDIATGQLRQLTLGQHNVSGVVSPDGKQILLHIYANDFTKRPFTFTTAVVLNLQTMQADTLYAHDGFAGSGQWSPDGQSIVFQGSPEAFGGIGNRTPEGMTASMIQQELFRYDLASHKITPLTADLDPSIVSWQWSKADGMIYALCENRDNQDIFRINPQTAKAERLPLTERYVLRFDIAEERPLLTYYGQGHSNSDRLYVFDLKKNRETLVEDLDAVRMKDIELGEFGEWNFRAERGDTIYGRYYLPPHFDASKQYPMLVYYYGGCSPVGRYLDSYYSFHGWAAMGYVVYVIQPSGCTGFGQEFAARHVNAYGDYTADDIIQGTKQFCQEHPFVNKEKIGCLGASYGGFMTMYLQTQTDIFAAAMSHAGISDPTSYWGYGYWGYSYSTISAANSYPWNNRELFTDHAPLTLADRIHTPILFMHGSDDTNVPINESIQLFTALKILGRETAFVTVKGQNHHILDYSKRIKWQNTIYAWFERWLKDDPTWWNTMYPEKNL